MQLYKYYVFKAEKKEMREEWVKTGAYHRHARV